MDLEEFKGFEVFFENYFFNIQLVLGFGGFVILSEMELDIFSVQELVQQLEVLFSDLGGLFLDGVFCFLYIVIG